MLKLAKEKDTKMKKLLPVLIFVAVCLVCLAGCVKYTSHYSALMMISTNTPKEASVDFSSLKGSKVFKLKSDGVLNYSGKLGTGNATVFYDYNGTKMELFSISSGQEVGPASIKVSPGTVYVIVQTDGRCGDGHFSFDVK